eukprot:TRINITY_DN9018_c0_g1_i3.p1 TRINITY_DN9018_c0_g1~~TRINITY_DN9018_c0_g1_i3.p1  ORF type:complete len:626 (+),score=92.25 TRINITY_DN9018_c0_g1_i3:57-1934(+)
MRAARIKVVPLLLIGAVVLSIIVAYSSQRPSKGKKKEAKEETWSGVINNLIDSEQDHELRREAEDLALANKHLADALESLSGKRAEMMGLRSQLSELDEQQQQLGSELHRLQSEHHKGNNVGLKIKQSHEAIEGSKNLSPEEIKRLEKKSFQRHLFNEYKSSLLPLDRPVPDVRHKSCHNKQWPIETYPKASVIICFVNEAWSALLRTVVSVLNRSPPELVHEIILLDDASDADWLGSKLTSYMEDNLPSKVKYVRSDKRLGLIRARLLGAEHATGEVLVFLDSHCEANVNWLEPILDIIAKDRTHVVTPVIDSIDHDTMEYLNNKQDIPAVGTFDWTMDFNWKAGVLKPGQKHSDPIDSPTMAGGLFAMERKYFYELGSYDQQMDGWGGENLEMSFRIWQCGGRLVTAPCSHVGHIFRDSHPYTIPGSSIHHTFIKNSKRVAEVWMDDYKRYFYDTRPQGENIDPGDMTDRKQLRQRLHCKPFKWFLQEALPDLFIPDDAHIKYRGSLHTSGNICLDKMGHRNGGLIGAYPCHNQGANQNWMLSINNEMRAADSQCMDAWDTRLPGKIHIGHCHGMRGNQEFVYDPILHTLKHKPSQACMQVKNNVLQLDSCRPGDASQTWFWN